MPDETQTDTPPAYLIVDTESVPDGRLLAMVKWPGEEVPPEEAIDRAQREARAGSSSGSDFLPVTFQVPVAACVLRVGGDFSLQALTALDAPHYRPRQIVEGFWHGVNHYLQHHRRVRLVTFNGRGFDLPLLELAAFRYGIASEAHFGGGRRRAEGWHLDLMDWLTNYGAIRAVGGLNLLSKMLGKPGKMAVHGDKVLGLHREGKLQEINDYCMFDTLDTYFVFLRTRVLSGELNLEQEHAAVGRARGWLEQKSGEAPGLKAYLAHWGDWVPWP